MIINGEIKVPEYRLVGINEHWIKQRLYAFGDNLIEIKEIMDKTFNYFISSNFNEKCELQIINTEGDIIESKIYPDEMV